MRTPEERCRDIYIKAFKDKAAKHPDVNVPYLKEYKILNADVEFETYVSKVRDIKEDFVIYTYYIQRLAQAAFNKHFCKE